MLDRLSSGIYFPVFNSATLCYIVGTFEMLHGIRITDAPPDDLQNTVIAF